VSMVSTQAAGFTRFHI